MNLSKYLEEQKTDAELMAELYADGMCPRLISEKFDLSLKAFHKYIQRYKPSPARVEKFKRDWVRARL